MNQKKSMKWALSLLGTTALLAGCGADSDLRCTTENTEVRQAASRHDLLSDVRFYETGRAGRCRRESCFWKPEWKSIPLSHRAR